MSKEVYFIKAGRFYGLNCPIYGDGHEVYMSRTQIGRALEYPDPRVAVAKIHDRHRARFDRDDFSTVAKVVTVDGKERDSVLYTRKGIMEICRWSDKPRADALIDFVWDVMDALVTGTAAFPTRWQWNALNSAARIILRTYREADISPKARLTALSRLYAITGLDILPDGFSDGQTEHDLYCDGHSFPEFPLPEEEPTEETADSKDAAGEQPT